MIKETSGLTPQPPELDEASEDSFEFETACKAIHTSGTGFLRWEWDDRFLAALSSFPVPEQDRVNSILGQYFTSTWDKTSVGNAPEMVQRLAGYLGGIGADQALLSPSGDNIKAVAALWPWGNGRTVSIRILPVLSNYTEDQVNLFLDRFKGFFSLC